MTPLLALVAFPCSAFRRSRQLAAREEPQIDVTMADVMAAFPPRRRTSRNPGGAPAEQVLSRIAGIGPLSVSRLAWR